MRVLAFLVLFTSTLYGQDAAFRVNANFIKVPVTVFDSRGEILSGLTRESFQLFDEETAQPIENFLLDYAPINVLLLLDTSGSLEQEVEEIRTAALRFAGAFSKEDRISIISFADEVVLLRDWTNKYKAIKKSLKKLKPGYRTALYDALRSAVSDQFQGITGRRVIILLTDGLDNASRSTYDGLVANLTENDVTLFIISRTRLISPQVRESSRVKFLNKVMKNVLKSDGDYVDIFFKEKETAMRNLAETTGGARPLSGAARGACFDLFRGGPSAQAAVCPDVCCPDGVREAVSFHSRAVQRA